ncbi:hypothetical protein CHLRE_15g635067v5 [Chlamydomonas reinhardtii]|uniref:PBP domain-containing protein n=1 Tax=Chlamydomonas reinhardtii TaxID=3055 RepID=A0A2K3CWD5_CHLRE|nr:uncharacterized protein CHLRE_15g635067v5 [Chlamydomonas reinhardtii]PNW72590.1 hypothetical protein CHLRE_15g635067v5 [Chlamydomonas reinhardtii]
MRCSVLVATLLAATTLWAAPALAQNEATQPLYQLHGSGTSNPAPIIWRVMDLMMARTKPRVAMSYRSVGSGSGAADFLAGANAFGCGDVPLPNSTYFDLVGRGQTVMHVPYLIGSVSVFHNVPGVGDGLVLPPCTLARIMRGDITVWNHPDILANNTHLPDLATVTAPIRVVHRNPGSSSTYAITHYFNKACPSQWSAVAGSPATKTADVGSSRTVGVTTEWPADAAGRWQTVLNSQEMVEQIAGVPFSLGYVESGQGLNAGLSEVALQNANGTSLVSSDSDVAPPSFIAEQFPINNLTSADWVQVNPVYASPSNPRQWPLVLGTYFYVRANATFLGDAGGLLQLFLNFMLGPDVTALMPSYFFVPFSTNDRATIASGVTSALTLDPASTVNWRYEGATNNTFGQQNFVFSARRDSYLTTTVSSLALDVADAKKTLMMGDAYQDDNPGLTLPGNPIRLITAGPDDTDARAVLAYLSDPALVGAGCGGAAAAAAGGLAIPTAGVVDNAAVVDEVAAGALYSGLGFVAASELAAAPVLSGVHAAALPSLVSNTFVRPNQTGTIRDAATCPASGCGGAVAAAYSAAFDEILAAAPAGSLGVPAAVDGDWSNFTARPLGVKPTTDVYPIFRLDFYVAPADLVHFGAAGEAARGLLVYGLSGDLAARISGGLGPAFAGLGPAARRLAAAALAAVQTAAADGGKWAVAASSAAANASQPATTSPALVLSRLPPLADSALPASDAAVFAASSSDSSSAGDLSGTAYQAAAEAVRTTWDKASLAYDIAVAALVLACVLSVAALGLAVWALQKVRAVEGAATAGGGCFTPAATKYEKHTDVAHPPPGLAAGGPATTAVEMGAYDKI